MLINGEINNLYRLRRQEEAHIYFNGENINPICMEADNETGRVVCRTFRPIDTFPGSEEVPMPEGATPLLFNHAGEVLSYEMQGKVEIRFVPLIRIEESDGKALHESLPGSTGPHQAH